MPDEALRGTIIAAGPGGTVVYESSSRAGDALRIRTTLYGRISHPAWLGGQPLTDIGTLGQMADYDNMGSAAPESWLRVYEGDRELTRSLEYMFLNSAQPMQPTAGAGEWLRYPRSQIKPLQFAADGLYIPANTGGNVQLRGDHRRLSGVFTVRPRNQARVRYLSTQEATWQTYIGVGAMGAFAPLMSQLQSRYGNRHGRIPLDIPAGANYILVIYPLSPGDPYFADPANHAQPTAGTVRLSPDGAMLCADFRHSGAFPLRVGWQDADQVLYTPYLSLLRNLTLLTPPELVLPEGMPYDPCYSKGNCAEALLERIYNATMSIRIVYLSVQPPDGVYTYVPLRMADDTWTPGLPAASLPAAPAQGRPAFAQAGRRAYLPAIISHRAPTGDCPCGAFEPGGRMIAYQE